VSGAHSQRGHGLVARRNHAAAQVGRELSGRSSVSNRPPTGESAGRHGSGAHSQRRHGGAAQLKPFILVCPQTKSAFLVFIRTAERHRPEVTLPC